MKRTSILTVYCLIILTLTSCLTPSVKRQWRDDSYTKTPFKKVVVLALFKNIATREAIESAVVSAIMDTGTDAMGSLDLILPSKKYNHSEMEGIFAKYGIDAILIITLKDINKKAKVIHPNDYWGPDRYYFLYDAYYTEYAWQRDPGGVIERDYVDIQSVVFANDTDRMVWQIETVSVEQYQTEDGFTNVGSEAPRLAEVLVKNMLKAGILTNKSQPVKNRNNAATNVDTDKMQWRFHSWLYIIRKISACGRIF